MVQAESAARDADDEAKRVLRERCMGAEADVAALKKQLVKTEARAATGAEAAQDAEAARKELEAKVCEPTLYPSAAWSGGRPQV